MNKLMRLVLTAVLLLLITSFSPKTNWYDTPSNGYVPDRETAIKIGVALLNAHYSNAEKYQPYTAELIDNKYWVVYGYLPPYIDGGTPTVEIMKKNCKVRRMYFGK